MRSVWALMAAPSRAEQFSAISSILSSTSNTSLGGCPPGSYPSARWRKYSESDKPHFRANIVTFFFSVTVTRKMAHYARDIFSPRGIEYKYTRTEQKRLFEFFHDDDDGDDDVCGIPQWNNSDISISSSSSSASSLRSLEGSKHGRSVATWQPAERPTGTAPNPCEAASA